MTGRFRNAAPVNRGHANPQALLRDEGEQTALSLPPLLVEAEQVARTLAPGVHGRKAKGPGETFWQYRRYGEGDPAASIDWRQSARTDKLYVRETEWEAAHTVYLWADGSPSMDYASGDGLPTKADRAALIAMALAVLLARGGERVGSLDGTVRPGNGRGALRQLAEHLTTPPSLDLGMIPQGLGQSRSARIVLVSDFLMETGTIAHRIRQLSGAGTKGHLVHVLDPAEEDLPFTGRAQFEDLEEAASLTVGRAESLREDYARALARHRAAIQTAARRSGWTLTTHRTDRTIHSVLAALHDLVAGKRYRRGF